MDDKNNKNMLPYRKYINKNCINKLIKTKT